MSPSPKLTILEYPDPLLSQIAVAVELKEALQISERLIAVCKQVQWGNCVGMAAPQIGISKRVFVALGKVYINPWIVWRSKTKKTYFEGCYSLGKHAEYKIKRPNSIKLVWQTELGERVERRFYGHEAEIIQHEYDHLEGLLINRGALVGAQR